VRSLRANQGTYGIKIVKSAAPGKLPFEQPTQYDLVINRNTARAASLFRPTYWRARTA